MFDFIRKKHLWRSLDAGYANAVIEPGRFSLKTIQDLVVYSFIADLRGKIIGEVGGGNSRVLPAIAGSNSCFNIDKFQGAGAGPKVEIALQNVKIIKAFLGDFSPRLQPESFDVVFSISVIEHVPDNTLESFLLDGLRILRPGGLMVHAIDMYLEDDRPVVQPDRFDAYKRWMESRSLTPVGAIFGGPPAFSCDMATHPDDLMYRRRRWAPSLDRVRQTAQSVSLILAARKR